MKRACDTLYPALWLVYSSVKLLSTTLLPDMVIQHFLYSPKSIITFVKHFVKKKIDFILLSSVFERLLHIDCECDCL